MSASNQFTDAPSDDADNDIGNYATWNPLDQQYSGFTYAEGNKRISTGVSSGGQTTSTMALGSGRYYAEVLINSWASSNGVGIAKPGEPNNGSVNVHLQHVIVGKIYNNGVENQTGLQRSLLRQVKVMPYSLNLAVIRQTSPFAPTPLIGRILQKVQECLSVQPISRLQL